MFPQFIEILSWLNLNFGILLLFEVIYISFLIFENMLLEYLYTNWRIRVSCGLGGIFLPQLVRDENFITTYNKNKCRLFMMNCFLC